MNTPRRPTITLWNPSVRNHLVLPNPTIIPTEPHIAALGFGVTSSHAHVKVVRLVYRIRSDGGGFNVPPQVEIFCLKTWSWRRLMEVNVTLRAHKYRYSRVSEKYMYSQAFLNGVVHWLTGEPWNNNPFGRTSILAFDIGDEVFGEVMLPDELARVPSSSLSIFVIENSLGIVKYDAKAVANKSCDVWVMKEYCVKESWTKLYTIDLGNGFEDNVVAFSKSGEPLLALRNHVTVTSVDLVAYNPGTRRIKDLGINGTNNLFFYVYNYVESLLLLR